MSNNFKKTIRRLVYRFLSEAYATPHLNLRVNQRVKGEYTTSSEFKSKQLGKKQFTTISDSEHKKNQILSNLNLLKQIKFPDNEYSIAVKIFGPEKNRFVTHFYDENESEIGNTIIPASLKKFKEEVEDSFWAIIRNNEITTLNPTKGSRKPGNIEHYLDIDFIKEYIKEKESYNLSLDDIKKVKNLENKSNNPENQPKESTPHLLFFNLDGTNYVADSDLEQVYKKNKPNEKYDGYDFVEDLVSLAKGYFDSNQTQRGEYLVKISNDILAHFV